MKQECQAEAAAFIGLAHVVDEITKTMQAVKGLPDIVGTKQQREVFWGPVDKKLGEIQQYHERNLHAGGMFEARRKVREALLDNRWSAALEALEVFERAQLFRAFEAVADCECGKSREVVKVSKPAERSFRCPSCEASMINGVLVHEAGCPDAWRTETRECKWCGRPFKPESREQRFCDEDCARSYNE